MLEMMTMMMVMMVVMGLGKNEEKPHLAIVIDKLLSVIVLNIGMLDFELNFLMFSVENNVQIDGL
jgi:hypothetical protein